MLKLENLQRFLSILDVSQSSTKKLDVEGFEPSTSRMQSVRATTVPNAHVNQSLYYLQLHSN